MTNVAVFTGDLIASTAAKPEAVEQAMAAMADASSRLFNWMGADLRFTRFRGDGWQIYLPRPQLTARVMLYLIASLRAADTGLKTRLSIAIAPYEGLGSSGLSGASGPAFVLSGRNLDQLGNSVRQMAFAAPDDADSKWKTAVLDLAFHHASRWSREQAEAVAPALFHNLTQESLAERLNVTRQAVQARLKGAGFNALQSSLSAFEDLS